MKLCTKLRAMLLATNYYATTENACKGGATFVDNDLVVDAR